MRRLLLSLSVLIGLPLAATQLASAVPGPAGGELTVAAPVVAELVVADHDPLDAPQEYAAVLRRASAPVVPVRCDGDGVRGPRVQAVYAHVVGQPDRSAEVLRKAPSWLGITNGIVARSSAGRRHVRFVTDRACRPTVTRVTVPASAGGSFRGLVDALKGRGLGRSDRKYLIWTDTDTGCGVGSVRMDDSPGLDNANNVSTGHAVVYRRCWGGRTEAHELVHTLGAVLRSAPSSTGRGHCRDSYDTMCYADGPGAVMRKTCPDPRRLAMLDCNGDTYFNVTPRRGGYLASHWNVASSAFLIGAPAPVVRPTGPARLTARWDTGARELMLRWPLATVSGGALSGHHVYVDGDLVATRGPRVDTVILPLLDGTHTYSVAGFSPAGDSRDAPSVTVSVSLPRPPAPPAPPRPQPPEPTEPTQPTDPTGPTPVAPVVDTAAAP